MKRANVEHSNNFIVYSIFCNPTTIAKNAFLATCISKRSAQSGDGCYYNELHLVFATFMLFKLQY